MAKKKKGKIASVFKLHKKGKSVKEIAEELKINERQVRSYLWRSANPEKYKALLQRYYSKRRLKKENEAMKAAVKNNAERKE